MSASGIHVEVDPEYLDGLSPSARREVEQQMSAVSDLLKLNPLLGYIPHEKQATFHAMHLPNGSKIFAGGNRAGKTTTGVVDDLIQTCDREILPEHLLPYKRWDPPFYCRVMSPKFSRTMEGVVFEKIREWCPTSLFAGGSWETAYDKQRYKLHFANGSWWDFMSYEMDLDAFGGVRLHRAHYDEEPPGERGQKIRNENQSRLWDLGGDEIFTMTPLLGISFVYDELWCKRDGVTVDGVVASVFDNPHVNHEAITKRSASLSKEERKARIEGEFVALEGLIYPEFSERHIVDPYTPEQIKGWPTCVAIDPGIRATGVIYGAFAPDGILHVFDDLFMENATVEAACEAIKAQNKAWGFERPDYYIIDPAARARSQHNAEQIISAFAREDVPCIPAQNAVEAGILIVKRRLQAEPPTLRISEGCKRLIWELQRYQFAPGGEFKVLKRDDHESDCLRYLCSSFPTGSAPDPQTHVQRPAYSPGKPIPPPWQWDRYEDESYATY